MNLIPDSELIINPDGSIYHLNLLPGQIADDIITVGDPDRVDHVTQYFDSIESSVSKREFKTVTGTLSGKRFTVISTGIGTDNIDIVFTEIDALANVDFDTRMRKDTHRTLNFYRIGTSGTIRAEIPIDSTIISAHAIGLEGLMHYYDFPQPTTDVRLAEQAKKHLTKIPNIIPYATSASTELLAKYNQLGMKGITITATGFYGPQGRKVIASPISKTFIDDLAMLEFNGILATNLEMETAGIYGMASLLGHRAISFNAILANREQKTFSSSPKNTVDKLIQNVLKAITAH